MSPLETYLTHLNTLNPDYCSFTADKGKKYFKVVQTTHGGYRQRSVHAFVDIETNDVYKAAGWKAPAKGARMNLVRDMDRIRQVADIYTSYLYLS